MGAGTKAPIFKLNLTDGLIESLNSMVGSKKISRLDRKWRSEIEECCTKPLDFRLVARGCPQDHCRRRACVGPHTTGLEGSEAVLDTTASDEPAVQVLKTTGLPAWVGSGKKAPIFKLGLTDGWIESLNPMVGSKLIAGLNRKWGRETEEGCVEAKLRKVVFRQMIGSRSLAQRD